MKRHKAPPGPSQNVDIVVGGLDSGIEVISSLTRHNLGLRIDTVWYTCSLAGLRVA